jgi:hypothetical protein
LNASALVLPLGAVLDRVPADQAERVVVLDPGARGPVVALDVLGRGDPDLRADVLLGAMQSIFRDSWGIRSDLYGRLALRTLAGLPGATLADIGRLFADAAFRRQAVSRLTDPLLLAQWQTFEALSPAEQAQHVQAPMAKLMALIGRPAVRSVIAAPEPKLDVAQLLSERGWLTAPARASSARSTTSTRGPPTCARSAGRSHGCWCRQARIYAVGVAGAKLLSRRRVEAKRLRGGSKSPPASAPEPAARLPP